MCNLQTQRQGTYALAHVFSIRVLARAPLYAHIHYATRKTLPNCYGLTALMSGHAVQARIVSRRTGQYMAAA